MVLERYRSGWDAGLGPIAHRVAAWGVTPNGITLVSLAFAVFAGLAFALSGDGRTWLLFAGGACVSINAILDGLDGKLARITNTATPRGDYLDHVVDRYADVAILTGLALAPSSDLRWGLLAIVGTFLTSYMGTQAQALGLGRNYGGWLGRADRLVLLIAVPVIAWFLNFVNIAVPYNLSLLTLLLVYLAVVGNITALQRFWNGWKQLGERA